MANNPLDPVHQRIVLGTKASAAAAAERALQTATNLVVWRDNRVVEISPNELSRAQSGDKQKP